MRTAELIACIAIVAFSLTACGEQRDRKSDQQAQEDRAQQARFQKWAYIAKEKEIAPGETVKLVIVPHPWGEDFDTRCLIYTHTGFRQSTMICPGTINEVIAEHE